VGKTAGYGCQPVRQSFHGGCGKEGVAARAGSAQLGCAKIEKW